MLSWPGQHTQHEDPNALYLKMSSGQDWPQRENCLLSSCPKSDLRVLLGWEALQGSQVCPAGMMLTFCFNQWFFPWGHTEDRACNLSFSLLFSLWCLSLVLVELLLWKGIGKHLHLTSTGLGIVCGVPIAFCFLMVSWGRGWRMGTVQTRGYGPFPCRQRTHRKGTETMNKPSKALVHILVSIRIK